MSNISVAKSQLNQDKQKTGSVLHLKTSNSPILGRKGLERLDLLLLLIEAIDLNGSRAILWNLNELGLQDNFPNLVEIWKVRCHSPLRKTTRRGKLKPVESEGLISVVCIMSERLYPLLRQLLSSKEPPKLNKQRWELLSNRLNGLIKERLNLNRAAVQSLLKSDSFLRDLVFSLALSVGEGGVNRLRASLQDPRL